MTTQEALELAIAALEAQADLLKNDERAVEVFGEDIAGPAVCKHVRDRKRMLEAVKVLQKGLPNE